MFALLMAAVFLLLLLGGILAYKNSRLISDRKQKEAPPPPSSLMYSVRHSAETGPGHEPGNVPLFRFTVSAPAEGSSPGRTEAACILYRVAEGTGEMKLGDAQRFMLSRIRQAVSPGTWIQHEAFLDKAAGSGEQELMLNLADAVTGANAVKEETVQASTGFPENWRDR